MLAPVPRSINGVPYESSAYSTASLKVRLSGFTPSRSRSSEAFSGMKGCKRMPTMRSDSPAKKTVCSTVAVSPSLLFCHGATSEKNRFVCLVCQLSITSYIQTVLAITSKTASIIALSAQLGFRAFI